MALYEAKHCLWTDCTVAVMDIWRGHTESTEPVPRERTTAQLRCVMLDAPHAVMQAHCMRVLLYMCTAPAMPRESVLVVTCAMCHVSAGIADQATWTALLAEIPELRQDIQEAMLTGKAPSMQGKADTAAKAPTQTPTPKRSAPAPTPQASKPQPNKISSRPPSRPAQSSPVSDQTLRARAYYSTEEDTGPSFNPSFANFDNEEPMPLDALDAYYAGAGATDTSARDGGSVPPKTAVDVSARACMCVCVCVCACVSLVRCTLWC